jgi:protein-glutamine gamma-glutamyltransferase
VWHEAPGVTFERQFLLAGHALALIGVAALATTHELHPAYAWLAVAAILASLWCEWRGWSLRIPALAANGLMLAALAFTLAPVLFRGASPVRAIGEFLLVLVALKSMTAKAERDWLQIYVLSFFQLLAASALTVEPVFGLVFVAYLLLVPCVMVLFLLRREARECGSVRRLAEEAFVEPSLIRSITATTAVLFVSTVAIFVVFPRMGAGYFAAPFSGGAALTGFSEEVGPGAVAALKQDDGVALRATLDHPELIPGRLYWRGAALDHFDGRIWRRRPQELRPLLRPGAGIFSLPLPARRPALVREEIILEPQDSSALFSAGSPVELRGRFSEASIDAIGNLRVLRPIGVRARYEVQASFAPRRSPPTAETLALPKIDPRIVELARQRAQGVEGGRAMAEALLAVFRRGFRYTLQPGDPGGEDPLVWFLFETRRGHCEYFASAYAVLLRVVGIPSLVVNGYAGGEWNPYGGYFLVRQRDAHSWVEAYVDGEWLTFDPTPPGPPVPQGLRTRIADVVDALQMHWYRYVINYTLEDQAEAALSLRDASRRLWRALSGGGWRSLWERSREESSGGWGGMSWWGGLAAIVFGGLTLWLWRARRNPADTVQATPCEATRRYLQMLGVLERHGLEKRPGETPEEFCRRIAGRLDGQAERVARITALYEQARFSGYEFPPDPLEREIEALGASLVTAGQRVGAPTLVR